MMILKQHSLSGYLRTILLGLCLIISLSFTCGCDDSDTDEASYLSGDSYDYYYDDSDDDYSNDDGDKDPDLSDGNTIETSVVPAYQGNPSVILNNNMPLFAESDLTTDDFEIYSDLDSLGRCGVAYGNICTETQPEKGEERGKIGNIRPSGWQTIRYNGIVDGNYLYNRCHLIGWQLGAENDNQKNLITGTRYMNNEGMLPYEDMVDDYLEEHPDHHVLYRVTPVFIGSNLVASGVRMEAHSVEDNGCVFHVFCYNVQPGIIINYKDGTSKEGEDTYKEIELDNVFSATIIGSSDIGEDDEDSSDTESSDDSDSEDSKAEDSVNDVTGTYVINTSSHKFHLPDCGSVKKMSNSNRQDYTGSRQKLIDDGYEPCKNCNP